MKKWLLALLATVGICGCNSNSTADIPAVKTFDLNRYLGNWYEIARLPNHFEAGMSDVTAEYSMRPDGNIKVVNRGIKNGKPVSITGIARPLNSGSEDGELEVSFFRPFYGAYRIIKLAPDYRYSVVTGSSCKYLWILARKPALSANDLTAIMEFLEQYKFPVNELIFSQR